MTSHLSKLRFSSLISEISAPVRRGPAFDDQYYERVKFKSVTG